MIYHTWCVRVEDMDVTDKRHGNFDLDDLECKKCEAPPQKKQVECLLSCDHSYRKLNDKAVPDLFDNECGIFELECRICKLGIFNRVGICIDCKRQNNNFDSVDDPCNCEDEEIALESELNEEKSKEE